MQAISEKILDMHLINSLLSWGDRSLVMSLIACFLNEVHCDFGLLPYFLGFLVDVEKPLQATVDGLCRQILSRLFCARHLLLQSQVTGV